MNSWRTSQNSVKLDFSHLGVWQSASTKGSTNAPETFCGSVCASNPQKVSDLQRGRDRLLGAGGGGEDTCPKGAAQKSGLGASGWPVSEPRELPCQDLKQSRAWVPRAPLPWGGWATSTPALFAPKWLKSSLTEFTGIIHLPHRPGLHNNGRNARSPCHSRGAAPSRRRCCRTESFCL